MKTVATVRKGFGLALVLALAISVSATTWGDKEVVCPLCKTKNTFMVINSYGSYIYSWPSKYQFIFWPYTDSPVLYSCRKCHLTAFMFDFEKLPVDKLPAIEAALSKLAAPVWPGQYTKIPMSERLALAEKVYEVLGQDDEAWCHFYRVVGYHASLEDKELEATAARRKARALAEKLAGDPKRESQRKEFLYVIGAMRFFTGDEDGALATFDEARKLIWSRAGMEKENVEGFDAYLSQLIEESIEGIADVRKARTEPVVPHRVLAPRRGWVWDVAISPDGSLVASAYDESITLWDAKSGAEVRNISVGNTTLTLAFSPDGQTLAGGGYGHVVELYDVATGRLLRTLEGHADHVDGVSFSPDGSTIASGSWDDTIRLWEAKTGRLLRTIKSPGGVREVTFSPDGTKIATTDFDDRLAIWNVADGKKTVAAFAENRTEALGYSADGKLVAGGGDGGTVLLWDASSGKLLHTLKGHTKAISAVAFSPDGQLLVSVAWDGTARLWDLHTAREMRLLTKRGGQFEAVVFSPDQRTIVTGSRDGTTRLWDATKEPAPPAQAEKR